MSSQTNRADQFFVLFRTVADFVPLDSTMSTDLLSLASICFVAVPLTYVATMNVHILPNPVRTQVQIYPTC
jgi:hypothetical protein